MHVCCKAGRLSPTLTEPVSWEEIDKRFKNKQQ